MACVHTILLLHMQTNAYTHTHEFACTNTPTLTVPVQVQNVQVFVYFPMLTGDDVSALVTWDTLTASEEAGFVQNYTVQVFQDGQLLTNVSSSACT